MSDPVLVITPADYEMVVLVKKDGAVEYHGDKQLVALFHVNTDPDKWSVFSLPAGTEFEWDLRLSLTVVS